MSPRRTIPQKKKQEGLPSWVFVAGAGVMVVIAVVVLFTLQTPAAVVPTTGINTAGNVKGNPNAPITMIELSDFQ